MLLSLFLITDSLSYRAGSIPADEVLAELSDETDAFEDVLDVVDSSLICTKNQYCLIQIKSLLWRLLHQVNQLFCMLADGWVFGDFLFASNFLNFAPINLVRFSDFILLLYDISDESSRGDSWCHKSVVWDLKDVAGPLKRPDNPVVDLLGLSVHVLVVTSDHGPSSTISFMLSFC